MNIQEIEQKLNECQKALAELKESKKENSGKWKPKKNDDFYYRDVDGDVVRDNWYGTEPDEAIYNNTPIFPTESECRKYWNFMDTVKEKSYEFSKEEWEDENVDKYYISIDVRDYNIGIDHVAWTKYVGAIYFKTVEDAQYIIDDFKEELLKY